MSGWKKTTVTVLVLAVVMQCAWLCVSAADVELLRGSENRDSVLIDVLKDAAVSTDFVREFPGELVLDDLTTQLPSAEPPVRETFEEIPNYAQESYAHALYGDGTVASCGSSITALAMVATYLTGYTYEPDELARSFAGKEITDATRLQYAANVLGLTYAYTDQWDTILKALKDGKCAIVQLDEGSLFAESGHFIVLKGVIEEVYTEIIVNEDGTREEVTTVVNTILVNDPRGANYAEDALGEKLASGFDEAAVSGKLRCGWVFDPAAIPENVQRYAEVFVGADGKRYEALGLTASHKQLLARVISVVGFGECVEGQQAMAEVLLNRMLSDKFPNELKEIVYGKNGLCEVRVLNDAELTAVEYAIVNRAIYGPYVLNEGVTEFSDTCH